MDTARLSPPMTAARPLVSLSPSPPPRSEGSYELKFLLPEESVEPVMAWARARIAPDPHAGPDGTYRIHSLYLDTPRLDVYHRSRGYRSSKYRIRRYGDESLLYLERKSKARGWVRKQRTAIADVELTWLLSDGADESWGGWWFRDRLRELALIPQSQVAYRRLACLGEAEGSPIRLTLDRELRCAPAATLGPLSAFDELAVAGGVTVLELKFRNALPRLFKELVREFGLSSTSASKYRRSIELCGLADRALT
jgi:hypothetical protein